jgi:endoglucanase
MSRHRCVGLLACLTVLVPLFAVSSAVRAAPPPIVNLSPPTITGNPVVGQVLTASQGTWTEKGPNPTFSYQWLDCTGSTCTPIAKGVATTYTVASADVGLTIEVAVTATNKFAKVTASSKPTATVTAPVTSLSPPTNFHSTSTQQTSVATSWTASTSPGVVGYTVYKNGSALPPVTGTSFTFTGLTCGTTYTFAVDAYNATQHSTQATLSTATAACSTGTAPVNTGAPVVTGLAQVGSLLTTTNGTWSGTTPMTFTYKWYDCDATGAACTPISTPSSASYTLTSTDLNHTIRAQVTAKNTVNSASAMSAPTALVKSPPTASGLHVSGNQLLDASGKVVRLHGVNRSGTEYACVQGWGIFDGPTDAASILAIASWHANIVHLGLNEDCILGINGVPAAYSGANYMNAIVSYVNALHAQGLYAEVALMWAAPGSQQATGHPLILDADHAGAALQAIANAFKNDPNTIIGLTSEPHGISWACWLNGGSSCSVGYTALGMQGALNAVRATGATNPVTVSGIDYANNLSQWLAYEPNDPAGQLMAEAHIYGKNTCDTTSCFDSQLAPVAAKVPMLWGETGETYDASDCGSSYISTFLPWADAHGVGYEAWTWDTWGGGCGSLALISSYDGTPFNTPYANYVHDHFLSLP